MNVVIQKQNGVPYYLQVVDFLMKRIESQDYLIGDKLPSEAELSAQFKVNRHTVRQAIGKLSDLGWVSTEKGKGSYVKQRAPVISYSLSDHTQFTENLSLLGRAHDARLISWVMDCPTSTEREQLRLTETDKVYRLEILRFVEDIPFSVATSILAAWAVPHLEEHLDSFHSLYAILERHYQFRPVRLRSTVKAIVPDIHDASFLPEGVPLLQIESLMIHPNGQPVEISNGRARGDMKMLTIDFQGVNER